MKKTILITSLVSLMAAPAAADTPKYNLSEYKTVAVQPVLGASNTPGVFESTLAAATAGFTVNAERGAATEKTRAALKAKEGKGFGFAGKAQSKDVTILLFGNTLGMIPTSMQINAEEAKGYAAQLAQGLPQLQGAVDPDVIQGLTIAMQAAQAGDFQNATKALLVSMAVSTASISKGSERAHGYMATGLYTGIATLFAAAGQGNQGFADLAPPLIMLLEQDAVMGGADRAVAAQLKVIAAEMAKPAPDLNTVLAAIKTMNGVKADQ